MEEELPGGLHGVRPVEGWRWDQRYSAWVWSDGEGIEGILVALSDRMSSRKNTVWYEWICTQDDNGNDRTYPAGTWNAISEQEVKRWLTDPESKIMELML